MRITAGHELFHLMQNLYDLETAPSTWLWMEEALSTWFERRMASDPNYIPATVATLSGVGGSDNYLFLQNHGLEYPPGDAKEVQNHGYGASTFLESITRRKGAQILSTIAKMMATRATGLFAHPLYSPVAAINSATSDVGSEWELFCESFMAGQVYGGSPVFPRPDVEIPAGVSEVYNWPSASDPGPVWTYSYPDLSARIYLLNVRNAQWPQGTNLTISLDGGGPLAAAIVYRFSKSGTSVGWTKVGLVRDTSLVINNAETLIANNQSLVFMVVNSRATAPYNNRASMTLRFSTVPIPAYRIISFGGFSIPVIIGSNQPGTDRIFFYNSADELRQHGWAFVAGNIVPLVWSGTSFSAQGRLAGTTTGSYYDITVSGQLNAAGTLLQTVHLTSSSHLIGYQTGMGPYDRQSEIVINNIPFSYSGNSALASYSGTDAASKISLVKFTAVQYDSKGAVWESRTYDTSKPLSTYWLGNAPVIQIGFSK